MPQNSRFPSPLLSVTPLPSTSRGQDSPGLLRALGQPGGSGEAQRPHTAARPRCGLGAQDSGTVDI